MKVKSYIPGRIRLIDYDLCKNEDIANSLELYIISLNGIKDVKINCITGSMLIHYDFTEINIKEIECQINKLAKSNFNSINYLKNKYTNYWHDKKRLNSAWNQMIFFGIFYLIIKLKNTFLGKSRIATNLIVLIIASMVTIISDYPVFKKYYDQIWCIQGDKFLPFLSILLAFVREGQYSLLLLFLNAFSDFLQSSSSLQMRKEIIENTGNHLELVTTIKEEQEELIPLSRLKPGDLIQYNTNDGIETKGIIDEGKALVTSVYKNGQTGAQYLSSDREVEEGMYLLSGSIKVKVTEVNLTKKKESSQLAELNIYNKVKKYQNNAYKLSSLFATLGYFVTGSLLTPLSVFLVMAPGAVEVALQNTLTNYSHLLARRGIHLKDVNTIEKIKNINSIIFDKTGTLTEEKMNIKEIHILDERFSEKDIVNIGAAAEGDVLHPVANAFKDKTNNKLKQSRDVIYFPARGIKSKYNNQNIIMGNKELLHQEGIKLPAGKTDKKEISDFVIPIYLAIDNQIVAIIELQEKLNKAAVQMIRALRKNHFADISIISGDEQSNVQYIASLSGVEDFQGGLSDIEKEDFVREKRKNGPVIMVGDGINDRKALEAADVGISFNNIPSLRTLNRADCIIDRNLTLLPEFINMGRESFKKLEENIRFSKYYNYIFGFLAMLGCINPFQAKAINTLNSLLSVLTGLRVFNVSKDVQREYRE